LGNPIYSHRVRKELRGYRAQATPKYMQDNEAIDSLVLMSYLRMATLRLSTLAT